MLLNKCRICKWLDGCDRTLAYGWSDSTDCRYFEENQSNYSYTNKCRTCDKTCKWRSGDGGCGDILPVHHGNVIEVLVEE